MNHLKTYKFSCLLLLLLCCGCLQEHENISSPYAIKVTGHDYEWHILYPGLDNIFDTADDIKGKQDIHLPVGVEVKIEFTSKDYLYFMELPAFGQIGMAVSEQFRSIKFTPNETGKSPLKGSQMCAYTHENLLGEVVVHSPYRFKNWRAKKSQKDIR